MIPVFNGERYIARTLDSVARQKRRPDRLIVLDNGSTDATHDIVSRFEGLRCEWRQNERNLGMFGNLNRALGFAIETEHLHLLHADDLIKPDFYERCIPRLEGVSGRALIYSLPEFIDENDLPAREAPRVPATLPESFSKDEFLLARCELQPIYFPGVLLRTAGQLGHCEFRLDMPQTADHVFWAEWATQCAGLFGAPTGLCQYRIHGGSGTSLNLSNLQSWVLDEWKAMQLIAAMLNERGLTRWVRYQKLKCIFAARSQVKIQHVKSVAPEFAAAIRRASREITAPVNWIAGTLAFRLRNLVSPAAPSSR